MRLGVWQSWCGDEGRLRRCSERIARLGPELFVRRDVLPVLAASEASHYMAWCPFGRPDDPVDLDFDAPLRAREQHAVRWSAGEYRRAMKLIMDHGCAAMTYLGQVCRSRPTIDGVRRACYFGTEWDRLSDVDLARLVYAILSECGASERCGVVLDSAGAAGIGSVDHRVVECIEKYGVGVGVEGLADEGEKPFVLGEKPFVLGEAFGPNHRNVPIILTTQRARQISRRYAATIRNAVWVLVADRGEFGDGAECREWWARGWGVSVAPEVAIEANSLRVKLG